MWWALLKQLSFLLADHMPLKKTLPTRNAGHRVLEFVHFLSLVLKDAEDLLPWLLLLRATSPWDF